MMFTTHRMRRNIARDAMSALLVVCALRAVVVWLLLMDGGVIPL